MTMAPARTTMAMDDEQPPRFVHAEEETTALLRLAERLAAGHDPILIRGETGTGKGRLARLIHHWSGREGAFVPLRAASPGEPVADSQSHMNGGKGLTGETVGGATDYESVVGEAEAGTLFIDEVAVLSPGNQSRILRLIKRGEILPDNDADDVRPRRRVDVRVVCATRRRLARLVREGRFHPELFHRLEACEIEIPPLRERRGDILPLAEHFLEEAARRHGKRVTLTKEVLGPLLTLPLRGNARELRSAIERVVMLAGEAESVSGGALEVLMLRQTGKGSASDPWAEFSLREEVLSYEARFIRRALKESGGSVTVAARLMGFQHHGSLVSLLEGRHKNLLAERTTAQKRQRSIIRK